MIKGWLKAIDTAALFLSAPQIGDENCMCTRDQDEQRIQPKSRKAKQFPKKSQEKLR